MKQTALRFGLFSAVTLVATSALSFVVLGKYDYDKQEIAGYLTMLLSMVFVFFGMKYYRDRVNGGLLTFGQGMKVGLLTVSVPAIGFGLFDILYTKVINPEWHVDYMEHYRAKLSGAELAEFEQQMKLFSNPLYEFLLMASTVLIVGVIVTIISALALKRKPARQLAL